MQTEPHSGPLSTAPHRGRATLSLALMSLFTLSGLSACKSDAQSESRPDEIQPKTVNEDRVLLSGRFEPVGKSASGQAEIIERNGKYELRLSGVQVRTQSSIRVLLVGLDYANSTVKVVRTKNKYDMAALDLELSEQRIELPSAPEPEIRSVVLWNPKYGANLAVAPLAKP